MQRPVAPALPAVVREPRNVKVSGFPSPRFSRFGAANRPNSISRVFSGCSSSPNLANRSRNASRNRSASVRFSKPTTRNANDEEAVTTGPEGNRRMVPGEPPQGCGRTAQDPQRHASGPLSVLRAANELQEHPAVLLDRPTPLAKVAQSPNSREVVDVGEIYPNPLSPPLVTSMDHTFLVWGGESRLRNPLQ
jgi:hypothetical protein